MNTEKIMVSVKRLLEIFANREETSRRGRRAWRFAPDFFLDIDRQINSAALKAVSAVIADIRREAGDSRFKAFSDDELMLATLKFASLYYGDSCASFCSNELAETLGVDRPECLAAVVEAAIMRKNSPLNGYVDVSVNDRGYDFNPLPDKLNALFLGQSALVDKG